MFQHARMTFFPVHRGQLSRPHIRHIHLFRVRDIPGVLRGNHNAAQANSHRRIRFVQL